jgi:hypothetical protein
MGMDATWFSSLRGQGVGSERGRAARTLDVRGVRPLLRQGIKLRRGEHPRSGLGSSYARLNLKLAFTAKIVTEQLPPYL